MKGKKFFFADKTLTKPLVFVFIFLQFLGLFVNVGLAAAVAPAPAGATVVTGGPVKVEDPETSATLLKIFKLQETHKKVDQGVVAAGMVALVNSFSLFMDSLAYNTATYISSGGKGQGALAFKDGFGSFLKKTALDSVGQFIEDFSEDALGVGLCQIPDLNVALSLTLGFKTLYGQGGPKSDCSWQDFRNNWSEEAFEKKYGPGGSRFLAETFSASLKVNNSDFGIALDTVARLDKIEARKREDAKAEREEGQGFKPLTDMITGNVKTPAQIVKDESSLATNEFRVKATNEQLSGILSSGVKQVFVHAGSVFLNTLTSQLLNQVLTKGFFGDDGSDEEASAGIAGLFNSPVRANPLANPYAQLLTARPATPQLNNFDLISEFASCPDSPGLNNCVMDTDFQKILSSANNGKPLTIQEALDKDLLHADWPLISPRREVDNANPNNNCYLNKYCYSNIQKLRKVRILPLGFEIAALRSDPDQPWTLGDAVRNFETCLRVNAQGTPDPNGTIIKESNAYPFCHLINPNWVIRAPAMVCDAKVITSSLLTKDSDQRREECVDVKTCIDEGENGSCKGSYGYCTQEKNIWRIPGESCPEYYNTCSTFTNSKSGKVESYLAKTVDYAQCSLDNVGCRAYSNEKAVNGDWVSPADVAQRGVNRNLVAKVTHGLNPLIYFDDSVNAESSLCRLSNNGCTGFFPAQKDPTTGQYLKTANKFIQNTDPNTIINLKKAPDYLKCYDAVPATAAIDWPTTQAEVKSGVSQNPACDAFASVCTEGEVGCEEYTPMASGPMIPGTIGAANVCSSQCVGYGTFKQEAKGLAKFSNEKFPLFFIPSQGESCAPQYAGCEEFTNIDASANGGEKLEYYTDLKYCEKPAADGSNVKTFYTWEGSIREGLSLKTHRILPIDQKEQSYISQLNFGANQRAIVDQFTVGSPAYGDDSEEALIASYEVCNKEKYNIRVNNPFATDRGSIDCKAFYDDAGIVYYRLLGEKDSPNKVVSISADCHPLRKTNAEFYSDESLLGKVEMCRSKGGLYNDRTGDCQRCLNGGVYENNACVYHTISKPGESISCQGPSNNPDKYKGCRAYTGSTANNLHEIIDDDFEIAANSTPEQVQAVLAPWAPQGNIHVSPESTHPGLHSLEASGSIVRTVASSSVASDAFYEITFWAKGNGHALEVTLSQTENGSDVVKSNFNVNPATNVSTQVSLGGEWQSYRLGPVSFKGTVNDLKIHFNVSGGQNAPYYLDHVHLAKVQDYIFLIKDSWKTPEGYDVPVACDATPADGLPGAALGCAAYKDKKQQIRYATGFEKLCREKAVGCEPVWDSHNTITGNDATQAQLFNALCNKNTGTIDGNRCIISSGGARPVQIGECTVPQNSTFCYVPKITLPAVYPAGMITTSTIIVPADTPSSTPIFLANRKEFQCNSGERGCQALGLEQQVMANGSASSSYKYSDVMVKNDPDKYTQTLCRDDLVGCSEFKSSGNVSYFKDPKITGNKLCYYKPQTDGAEAFGWLQDGVGKCSNERTRLCRTNNDCKTGGTCGEIGTVACYSEYQQQGGLNDIWSNNSTSTYQGFVGMCSSRYNQCTELVDHADTSLAHPKGQPYYVIYNGALTSNASECNGRASLNGGCVLFDKTDTPNKLFNTTLTYSDSEKTNPRYGAVSPNKTGVLDSNIILKVERDRMCSRWLQCSSKVTVTDESGVKRTLCYAFKECEKAVGDTCLKWVDDFETDKNIQDAANRLTYNRYLTRGTSWYDPEYTGYSLYNKYRIHDLTYLTFDFQRLVDQGYLEGILLRAMNLADRQYIAYHVDDQFFSPASPYAGRGCAASNQNESTDFKVCGLNSGGRCYNEKCLYPTGADRFPADAVAKIPAGQPNAGAPNKPGMLKILDALASDTNLCKGYPETESPFPTSVVKEGGKTLHQQNNPPAQRYTFEHNKPGYDKVQVCQDGNCSCGYTKLTYKNGTVDYWSSGKEPALHGVCSGGKIAGQDMDGAPCSLDSDCGRVAANAADASEVGECQVLTKVENHYGFKGFCLEYDYSRPQDNTDQPFACLTWLPIQVSASNYDSYNADEKAGYYRPEDADTGSGEVYCSAATQVAAGPYDEAQIDPAFRGNESAFYYSQYFFANKAPKAGPARRVNPADNSTCKTQEQLENCITETRRDGANAQSIQLACASCFSSNAICGVQTDGGPYETAICDRNLPKIYTAIQSWLWKDPATRNSVILRIEKGRTNAAQDEENYPFRNNRWGHDTVSQETVETVYSFAPNTFRGQTEFGTIMHPPRFWPLGSDRDISNGGYPYNERVANSEIFEDLDGRFLDTRPRSPNLIFNGIGDSLYRSSFESNLRETDLKRVRFLPLSYDDDAEGEVPPLMQSIDINFDELRGVKGNNEVKEAYAYTMEDSKGGHENQFPEGVSNRSQDSIVWNYVLRGDSLAEFVADGDRNHFLDYRVFNNETQQKATDNKVNKRNQIAVRYMTVYSDGYDQNHVPGFVSAYVPKQEEGDGIDAASVSRPGPQHDPFVVPCGGDDAADTNWLAIGMDFNEDGEFLGYISRWCNNGGSDTGIQFATVAELNDQCTEFVKVYDNDVVNPLSGTTNKAWTQRVWKDAGLKVDGNFVTLAHPFSAQIYQRLLTHLKREVGMRPFGSLNLQASDLDITKKLYSYTFRIPDFPQIPFGIPYSCTSKWMNAPLFKTLLNIADAGFARCKGVYVNENLNSEVIRQDISAISNTTTSQLAINQLFAETYAIKFVSTRSSVINVRGQDYSGGTLFDFSQDKYENHALIPPQIYSLDPAKCRIRGGVCVPGEQNNLTVNFRNGTLTDYDKDGFSDEDRDGDQKADPEIQTSSVTAVLNFFGYADDNRMPIRRVMVNWDDGNIINSDRKGFYRNHKPFCELDAAGTQKFCGRGNSLDARQKNAVTRGLTCSVNADCPDSEDTCISIADTYGKRFGSSEARACTEGYFEFIHEYTCSRSDIPVNGAAPAPGKDYVKRVDDVSAIDEGTKQRLLLLGLQPDSYVCVYKPKAQILDNWGWCNGSCNSAPDEPDFNSGCYNRSGVAETDQCAFNAPKGWTVYKGSVIVIPPPPLLQNQPAGR